MPQQREPSRSWWISALLLFVAILGTYAPAVLDGGFVWDDDRYVTENPALRTVDGLVALWSDASVTPQYYPLTHSTFWLEYQIWGPSPEGYHLVNVLLHATCAVLLLRVLIVLGVPGAVLAAALFALHPIQVESVAWITERKNVLSGALYMASLLCWVRFFRIGPATVAASGEGTDDDGPTRPSTLLALAGTVLFAAALLAKTVTATLPLTVAILLWWAGRRPARRHVAYLGAMLVAGALMGSLTSWLEKHQVGALGPEWAHDPIERTIIAGRAWWFYLGKLIWPGNLSFVYPRWEIDGADWLSLLWPAAAAVVLLVFWLQRKRIGRGPLACALHYSIALAPALGWVNVYPMRYSFVADHFQYLAGAGAIVFFAGTATVLTAHASRRVCWSAAGVVLLVLAGMSWQRSAIFEGQQTLWRDTLRRNPAAWIAHNNLGIIEAEAGREDAAARHFRRVIELKPDHPGARNNVGVLLLRQRRAREAAGFLEEAVRLAPDDLNPHLNLGDAYRALGNARAAEAAYLAALALVPLEPRALGSLANLCIAEQRFAEAVVYLERLAGIRPADPTVRANLAAALAGAGRLREAVGHFEARLALTPPDANVHFNYGMLLLEIGRPQQAQAQFVQALRVRPGFEKARLRLEALRSRSR